MAPTSPATSRSAADRCPGVLRLTEAADGCLARIRLPGGLVTGGQLRVLARLAGELGDGRIELTSRGNVQLRALAASAAVPLTAGLRPAGLLPSLSHDRVRNVLASPLAGLDGGGPDLTALVSALDAALCARPRLAELSGRFLFAVDDGRGDVAGLGADVVAWARADDFVVNGLAVGGPVVGGPVVGGPVVGGTATDQAVAAMLGCAEAFLDERAAWGGSAWRIADLPGGQERVRAAVAARLGLATVPLAPVVAPTARPVGIIPSRRVEGRGETARSVRDENERAAVVLIAPLGRLTATQAIWLAGRVAGRPARVTPWRSVVLPDQPDPAGTLREAASLGFGTDAAAPWLRVTACAGRPGCAHAMADVQADAAGFADRWPGRIVHVSGCARRCGRPAATEIDVTASSEGYQIAAL